MATTPSSSGRSPLAAANVVLPYRMHVSQRLLDLTRQKLDITRLPRDPETRQHQQRSQFGLAKAELEPLVDHWTDDYSWRAQEAYFNDTLPQFRVVIHGARLHFVHRQSHVADAIPLLFVHGWPESFIAVSNMIDALCNPVSTPPRGDDNVPAFHVVVPSIPGFGFSDQVSEEGNNISTTAELFDNLMKSLGYSRYITTGSGWGLNICRLMALTHSESCVAIHTANPEVPDPRFSFNYSPQGLSVPASPIHTSPTHSPGISPPRTPGVYQQTSQRPQTIAYALCDSPAGLLAYIVDAIQPYAKPFTRTNDDAAAGLQAPWTPTSLINWAMLYWLPGPEGPLRWLTNSEPMVSQLWMTHSNTPLAISQFSDQNSPQIGPVWAEAYHRIAMIRRRPGSARFPAWERPEEMVVDIRDLAVLVGPTFFGTYNLSPSPIGHCGP
ncbi:putative epoxide hydrolase [Pseudocercospora fuligena]|uniref:Putative epoxide hydrolase n=1 Tax=Pseudocercospora fuligena TaxID=685502 RepID=A0A8H6RF87_9PEZI|nr:putative epoxide hydrolase [Pseudocercospora fuligena]